MSFPSLPRIKFRLTPYLKHYHFLSFVKADDRAPLPITDPDLLKLGDISVKSTRGTTAWMYTVSLPRLEDVGQDRSKVSEYHFYLLFDDDLYEIFADNKKIAVLGEGAIRIWELGGKFE